jgi:predicted deacetylase
MRHPELRDPAVAIALHDVSPATWRECSVLLGMLDDVGATPLTLLVVPDYHFEAPVLADPAFCHAMDARLARGDELVLHGMHHVDTEPSPRTLRGYVERRLLTRAEGEFAALAFETAAARIAKGVALFRMLGWPLYGFVPPAWLANDASRTALARCGHSFTYMTVRSGIHRLPDWQFARTANLCYSPDSVLRRAYSRLAIASELRRARRTPLLRISLHPQDAREPVVLAHWQRLIADAFATRRAVTKHAWVESLRQSLGTRRQAQRGERACAADAEPARAAF